MRLPAVLALALVAALPALAQTPTPKLKNPPPPRPPAAATSATTEAEVAAAETPEKTQLELMQERLAEREAQAMRSICSNCGGRR